MKKRNLFFNLTLILIVTCCAAAAALTAPIPVRASEQAPAEQTSADQQDGEMWSEAYYRASSTTGSLSEAEKQSLDEACLEFMRDNRADMAVLEVTSSNYEGSNLADLSDGYYEDCGFGYGPGRDGFLMVWDSSTDQVLITGTSITSVTKVFEVIRSLSTMADMIYPVGSIYMNVSDVNPGSLFGGTWERIQGRFLLGASSGHAAGSSGGAETVTLTGDQLPAHTHGIPAHTHSVPDHVHTVPAHTHTATTSSAGAHRHKQIREKVAASGTARYAVQGTNSSVTANTESAGAHTHTVTVASKPAFNTTSSGSCTTGSTSGRTESAGGTGAVNIMPPFLAVYIWKRTA